MITAIRGMNDILPADMPEWHFAEETARRVFKKYGFSELRTPIMEKTEVFLRGMGQDTDVVEKQMYTFTDKSGNSVTLRPEATAGVLRAVIENGLLGRDPVQKIYSIGPMFRYERPQKGRYRQFHQINVERLGESDFYCDAETLALAYDLATSLGLEGVNMELNSLGCSGCRPAFKKALREFLEKSKDSLCPDCRRRMDSNPLRVLDCKVDECRKAVEGAPSFEDFLCDECREHHEGVLGCLQTLGVPYVENPNLVRGLDYYTRTTFEITAKGLGSQNAVAGGGRYDNLISTLGGPETPGIGFAFGLERVIMLMEKRTRDEEGCFVVSQGDKDVKMSAMALLDELRSSGLRAEAVLDKSFKAQMRRAGKSGYPVCAILGGEELENNTVTIKNMIESTQASVARNEVPEAVADLFRKQGEK